MKFKLSSLIKCVIQKSLLHFIYANFFQEKSIRLDCTYIFYSKQIYSISISNILVIAVFFHRIKEKDNKKILRYENKSTIFALAFEIMLGNSVKGHLGRMGEWLKPAVC